jgi:hypothetical protein
MANQLTVFDATKALQYVEQAKAALAKAASVGEVKAIHNNAEALKAAARKLKDKTAEAAAHEIRMRAERALGQLMKQQKKSVGFNKGGGDQRSKHRDSKKPGDAKPTLTQAGINKNVANRARNAAKPSDQEFEQKVAAEKEQIKSPKPKTVVNAVKILPGATEQCVNNVCGVIENTLAQMRRGGAAEQKIRFLFQRLFDELRGLENKTLPPKPVEQSVEERRALNTKLAEQNARESALA